MSAHQFGGPWTERKLAALREYLRQYRTIFSVNRAARKLTTIYVDAFAGTGERNARENSGTAELFGYDDDSKAYQSGSARIALSLKSKFHRYLFIDSKAAHVSALRKLIDDEFSDLAGRCEVIREDANQWLQSWCASQGWRLQRAVVFLDPYGMSVEWQTIEAIAKTQAIDLWILFPFAIGANRMMPKDSPPDSDWAQILTRVFGTHAWKDQFYRAAENCRDLFGDMPDATTKVAGADEILRFFIERLKTVFPHVVENPLILHNSHNTPMYALCFAAGHPKGGKTAVKIAAYLTRDN